MKMAKCYQQLFCERSCVRSHPQVEWTSAEFQPSAGLGSLTTHLLREPFQFCAFSDAQKSDPCDLLQGSYRDEVNYFLGNLKTEMRKSENQNIFYVRKIYIRKLEK